MHDAKMAKTIRDCLNFYLFFLLLAKSESFRTFVFYKKYRYK